MADEPLDPFGDFKRTARAARQHPLEPGGMQDQYEAEAEAQAAAPPKPRFVFRSGADIARPLRKIPWLCKALAIGPGRPTILGGYGGVGKTFAAQALALAIAAGQTQLWGCYALQHKGGKVRHIDHEQGQWITDWRYQRLAWSLGIDITELGERLEVAHCPDLYLTSPDAEKVLTEMCTGVAVLLIDSLRAACPGVDENDSTMGSYLYLLFRVSEATGCVIIVIHHEGKTSGENSRTGIEKLRGSSAIAAGAGSVLSFVKDPSGCIRIEHTRANLGQEAPAELVRLLDEGEIDENTEKSVGIKLEWVPREQLRQEVNALSDEEHERAFRDLCGRMLACIRRNQATPEGVMGATHLARLLHVDEHAARRAFTQLRESGAIESNGRQGKAARWQVAQVGPAGSEYDAAEGGE
jgi:hypothetical protein